MTAGPPLLPAELLAKYETYEWRHACAILKSDYPAEWEDVITVLRGFTFSTAQVLADGGRKTTIAGALDAAFTERGWKEKQFLTQIAVDEAHYDSPTHKVDCFKNNIALEIEWNNKDPFFDRDLNNFRLLFDLRVVSVGIIVTRSDELAPLFMNAGARKTKYGASTTHMSKLLPRIEGGGGAGCPILAIGITKNCYVEAPHEAQPTFARKERSGTESPQDGSEPADTHSIGRPAMAVSESHRQDGPGAPSLAAVSDNAS